MRDLPSGTVTFLFTDVEGSTRLLAERGDEYAELLAEHRRVLREAFARHGGVEVDTQGDSFFVAFGSAREAVAAAAEAQAALDGPIRVRMGLHTGDAQVTEEGYVGLDVHRAARIAAAGHGGQVVLSRSTCELVEDEVRDLGEHRLKDLSAPERLYQLGDGEFPPLRTLYRTNLPVPATPFLGRERELAEVVALLGREDVRLLTLTGPGGTGKTRLALQAAAALADAYPDGVFWVPLAPLRDAALVLETAARTLDARADLAGRVADERILLLLDNFEHVIDAAPDVSELLEHCSNLRVVATSRELLRVPGEQAYAVPSLAADDAIHLFLARARALRLDVASGDTVAELCERLDNLPLAIELAAARVTVLSPEQLLERLSNRLDLLRGGRGVDPRQQTLRATIRWSYDLLGEGEQRLFARLSVFAGGCGLEAAEQICDADLDSLQSLVEKSLLRHTGERFWLLETIREFAVERLSNSGEEEVLQDRHADYFLELLEAGDDEFRRRRLPLSAYVELVRREQDNARGALARYRKQGDAARAARLAGALHPLWMASAAEGHHALDDALANKGLPDEVRARLLWSAATVARARGDVAAEKRFLVEAIPLFERLGDRWSHAWALRGLGGVELREGKTDRARQRFAESEEIAVEIGDRNLLAATANAKAHVPLYEGDYEQARALFEEALQHARGTDDCVGVKFALANLGYVAVEQGRLKDAASLLRESLTIHVTLTLSGADDAIDGVAAVACARGDDATAARLLGATDEWRRRFDFTQQPFELAIRARTLANVRTALGEDVARRLAEEGGALGLDEAIELALESLD